MNCESCGPREPSPFSALWCSSEIEGLANIHRFMPSDRPRLVSLRPEAPKVAGTPMGCRSTRRMQTHHQCSCPKDVDGPYVIKQTPEWRLWLTSLLGTKIVVSPQSWVALQSTFAGLGHSESWLTGSHPHLQLALVQARSTGKVWENPCMPEWPGPASFSAFTQSQTRVEPAVRDI